VLPALAGELVERRVDVLVAVGGDVSARAAKAATSTIPIVFTSSGNPVAAGLVQSINRPGGNATGCIVFSTSGLNAKRLDFIREVVPGDSIVGILINPKYPTAADQARELERAAAKIGRNIFIVEASDDAELKAAFGALLQKRVGALIAVWDPFIELRRQLIIAFAAENHLPDMYQLADFALDGGLISYGPSISRRLCRPHPQRREAIRSADRAAHEIRAGHQPEDCERSRPQGAAFAACCRRRGDRIDGLFTAMPFVTLHLIRV
jgi:putative tryptophan/tyrosine transport system substrate-binding protein